MKKIIKRTENPDGTPELILYDDGSAKVYCTLCNKIEDVPPTHKLANALTEDNQQWSKTWKCIDCFRGRSDKPTHPADEADKKTETIQDRIAWNSAVNNARGRIDALLQAGRLGSENGKPKEEIEAYEKELREHYYQLIIKGHQD